MPSTTESIAGEVRAALARARLRSKDVAQLLGCSESAASRKVNGRVPFTVADLVRIAELLGTDPTRFYSPDPSSTVAPSTSAYTDVA
jgi:transcriptional regulator with XRE-family HTH domain